MSGSPAIPELPPPAGLQRIFGLGFGMAVVVGGVVGSGIMRNPGVVAAGFPNWALVLLAWLAGAVIVGLEAMSTVELGAAIPEEGGPYPLASRSLGPFIGFLVGWADWLQIAVSSGFIAVAFGEYMGRLGLDGGLGPAAPAIGLILACAAVNAGGARSGGLAQTIGSAVKALGLLLLVGLLLFGHATPTAAPPPPPAFSLVAAAAALRAIYGAYGGWHAPVYFSEEVKRPDRNVARATFSGIALVAGLYLLVNAAILHVLPLGAAARSSLPAADAARLILGPGSAVVVTALAIAAVASLENLQIMELVRTTFAMSRRGILPPSLSRVSPRGTPLASLWTSLIVTVSIVALAAVARGPLYEILLNIYAPFPAFIFFMLAVGVIRLRFGTRSSPARGACRCSRFPPFSGRPSISCFLASSSSAILDRPDRRRAPGARGADLSLATAGPGRAFPPLAGGGRRGHTGAMTRAPRRRPLIALIAGLAGLCALGAQPSLAAPFRTPAETLPGLRTLHEPLSPERSRVGVIGSPPIPDDVARAAVLRIAAFETLRRGFDWFEPIGEPPEPVESPGSRDPSFRPNAPRPDLRLRWGERCASGWSFGPAPGRLCPDGPGPAAQVQATTQIMLGHGRAPANGLALQARRILKSTPLP